MPMNPKLHLEKHSYRFAYMKKANLPDRSIVAPALTEMEVARHTLLRSTKQFNVIIWTSEKILAVQDPIKNESSFLKGKASVLIPIY